MVDVRVVVDEVCRAVRERFPGRVLSCYLCGSHATGTATSSSDVDLTVTFVDRYTVEEKRGLAELERLLAARLAVRLDLAPAAEWFVCSAALPSMRWAKLVWGTDITDRIRIEPVAVSGRRMTRAAFHYLWLLRGKPPGLAFPLDYPDALGLFFGYERVGVLRPDRSWGLGARQVVAAATMLASALLAIEHGVQVGAKAESAAMARRLLGEFGVFVADFYSAAVRWDGEMPTTTADLGLFREWCAAMLCYENRFVAESAPRIASWADDPDEAVRAVASACVARNALPPEN